MEIRAHGANRDGGFVATVVFGFAVHWSDLFEPSVGACLQYVGEMFQAATDSKGRSRFHTAHTMRAILLASATAALL